MMGLKVPSGLGARKKTTVISRRRSTHHLFYGLRVQEFIHSLKKVVELVVTPAVDNEVMGRHRRRPSEFLEKVSKLLWRTVERVLSKVADKVKASPLTGSDSVLISLVISTPPLPFLGKEGYVVILCPCLGGWSSVQKTGFHLKNVIAVRQAFCLCRWTVLCLKRNEGCGESTVFLSPAERSVSKGAGKSF